MRALPLLLAATAVLAAHTASAQESGQGTGPATGQVAEPATGQVAEPAPGQVTGPVTGQQIVQETPQHEHSYMLDRPHTVAEVEGGIIVLPTAPISASNRGGSTPIGSVGNGDATMQVGLHLLYRATREWAFGAGATFSPFPTSDPTFGSASGLPRTHSRSYLFMGGEVRYFAFRSRWMEGFFGLTGGAVIIADRFATNNAPEVPSILGTNTVTVSTEGFSVGVQAGADYLLSDSWAIGVTLRGNLWILPSEKPFSQETSCDPIGDCPTLTGSVQAFELGLTLGYRIPL